MADDENLLLDPGLGRKNRIMSQEKKKKKGRQKYHGMEVQMY